MIRRLKRASKRNVKFRDARRPVSVPRPKKRRGLAQYNYARMGVACG